MRANFERSALTETIVSILRGVNSEISYQTLANGTRVSIEQIKKSLPSAQRILAGEGILFGRVTGFGLRRLTDQDTARKSEQRKRRMFNQGKYGLKELGTIKEFERLSSADQLLVTTNRTVFSLTLKELSRPMQAPPEPKADPPLPSAENLINLHKSKGSAA